MSVHPTPERSTGSRLAGVLRRRLRGWAARPTRAMPYALLLLLGLLLWGRLLLQEPPRVATAEPEAAAAATVTSDASRQE